jgi:hypothetical protein
MPAMAGRLNPIAIHARSNFSMNFPERPGQLAISSGKITPSGRSAVIIRTCPVDSVAMLHDLRDHP